MTGTLDEVSSAIGGLQADVRNVGQNMDKLLKFMEDSHNALQGKIDSHAKDIDDLKSFKSRVYGVATVLGVISGGITQYLVKKL